MITKLMDRLLSGTDEGFLDKLDDVNKRGIVNDVDFKYVRMPDETIRIEDKDNGESTTVKKSGSYMVMKSDDDDYVSLPFSVRNFSAINSSRHFNINDLIKLFSDSECDYTRLFNNFGLKFNGPLSRDESNSIRNNLRDIQDKIEEVEDEIAAKENRGESGTESEDEHQKLVDERQKLRLETLKAKEQGLKGAQAGRVEQVNKALADINKNDIEKNKLDQRDSLIKQSIDKDKSGFNKNGSGFNQYKGTTGNKTYLTGRKTFSSLQYTDRFFSHAGYENEHTLVIGKLSELKLAPNEHSKSKLLGDLSNLIDSINDVSISKITKSMLSELKKIKLTDDQYTEILDDLIESLTTDSVTRMFGSVNQVTEAGHDIDDDQLMAQTRAANLGQDIHLDKMLMKGAALGLGAWGAANGFWGAFNPLGNALKFIGGNIKNWTQYIPFTQANANKQAQEQLMKYRGVVDDNGNPTSIANDRVANPVTYNLKAQVPLTEAWWNERKLKNTGTSLVADMARNVPYRKSRGDLRTDNTNVSVNNESKNIGSPNNQVKK